MHRAPHLGIALLVCTLASCAHASTPPHVAYGGPILSVDVELGHQQYIAVCGPCHEDHNDRRAPLLANVHLPPWAIRRQVREGDAVMTAIPLRRLSPEDLEALLAFFTTTGTCVLPLQVVHAAPAAATP
jgi:cytochrome c553